MKIYIASGLTHVPRNMFQEYTNFIHELARTLSSTQDHKVKYALVNSDPQLEEKPQLEKAKLCYLWDRKMVEEADVLIAEVSFPSTGLGIELQIAESKNIPIILCFRDYGNNKADPVSYENPDHKTHNLQIGEGFVSLMALGIPSIFKTIKYSNDSDGIENTINAINLLK
ncbi:MAG TPA: hypothetical protein PK325_01415 [Cyclobacteriaceae bacterium]|nr:nucleoside 2-deoxyribosyltransferase [Cyclobacteriaceae bacterium]HMV08072.1 hypothetical protein [Cyclobacteriaceae bacterium]HMV88288.1 hypothetical protein [Cyclobacteriaceae bacterium]HMX00713.1 hypothetical protein [Cyclobacteriaceae bacterium]HMX49412.1 hypothetical protein [Cyclobacteriaceae bacterium]